MAIQFFGSPKPTIGVEIELQLIDPETRDLTLKSIPLLGLCQKRGVQRVKAKIPKRRLNSYEELLSLQSTIQNGCSAKRQRAVSREQQNLQGVVDDLIRELETNTPLALG